MAVEDNLRDRAKEIRGAFEPSSVTNEAVGGLLLDIINFFLNYAGSGGEGGKPDARYWSKDELKVLDQYLYVLNDKIKAIYADESGDSELFKGHKWEDNFDQPLRTFDPVQFNSITSTEFESKVKGWLIDALGNAEFRDLLIRSFKSWNFAAGPLGAGVGMVNDDELQTDKLLVRKTMYVLEMMTQRMRFQGGIIVLSPATGFKIDSVEVFDTYYRVHCRPEDLNEFEVNDQARIQNFTGNNIKYLWSLVLSRGDDYIDISRVDKDGDGVPAEGDEIVQLGNRTNPDRQDAVLLSAVNGEVGIFTYYGINSFDLSNKEGSWLGKHGGKKGAVIRGEVHITAGSSGLEQFDEYEDVDKRIQDAKDLADSVQDVVNNLTSIIIPDMQGQIDGSIMSHEGKVPPTLTNEPAVNWTTEEEKNRHIGDYYDYYLTVDGEQVTERYKFSKVNGTYQWVRVADSGSALAASVAREALGLAGTKATITWGNTLPEAPYNINDMWIKLDGSMYICNHQRLDGETGSQSDWQLFNDTMLRLAKMADDNVITKEEKATLRDTWNQIQKEFTAYQAQATKYGVSITALQNAYNTLNTFLTNTVKIAQDIDSNLSVAQKTEYNQDFANYYSERTAFANVIAQKVADESVGNLQIGMVNLLKGSNVELGAQAYNMGRYYFDKKPEVGKTYTLVTCYTVGENNTHIAAYQDAGNYSINPVFTTKGSEIVESRTFEYVSTRNSDYMTYYQSPNDGTYGSKVHWAVLVEGNKGPNSWIPSQADNDAKAQAIAKAEAELAETKANAYADGIVTEAEQNAINEAQARLDALKIGSVNLVSRKMMLAWNEKNKDIAVWGQDSDGIYLNVSTGRLFDIISTSSYNPVFTLTFKPNTQYVFSVEWKHANQSATGNGLVFYIIYTDGTRDMVILSSDMTIKTRVDLISARDKTILRISSGYGNWSFNALVYSLALYEGNKVLTEIPVATEDLTGQSNVNLLDNSKFQFGTKGYEPNNQSTLNIVNEILQSRSSRTSGTPGVRLPIVHLNQGVYSFKVIVKGINIPSCYIAVYKGDMSGLIASTREYVSILPTFTEKSLTFANSEEGDYRIIIIWNASTATAYPAGLDIEYSMLTAGEIASQGWSPSPGDVAKDIKDVSDAVSNLDTTINTTFKDGIISEAEAKAIASNINVLNAEKADIDAYYTKLYANAYLTGTAKTNLASAKTAYNTAHTNLINSINTAIADGKATATEKADVNAKFTAYNTALSTYKTRVGEADKAIQDQIKALAEQDATNKVDGIDTGTRNLITDRQNVITSGSDVPADTTYSSVLNSKGEREVTVTRAKLDTSTSRYVFINSKLSEQVYPGYYVFSFDYKTNHDGGKIYLDWRNSDHSNALGYSKILENTNGEWKRGWFLCNWTTGTTQNRNLFSVNPTGTSLTNYVAYRNIKLVRGNKGWDDSAAPEDIDQAIQDAIAKTVDITSPSQVFKYGPGYTGTPTPSSIVLTATPRNFTPTSYQWQYLNGSTWTNISGATSSTYSIAPGNTTLFPSGTNVRTFRCICNGDEKLSDSFTIAKLADGATGADGKGVSSTVTTYQASTSGTTAPTGTWSSTIPAVPAGQFLWTRTVINYTSGSPSTMYSVSKIGADGTNGNAGNGVSSTVITYQASTSGTTAPTGTWSSTIPAVAAGQFLWTRTVINYTSGSPSTIYSVGMIGKTGADGKDAYTILLGNESHAFAGSTAAALAGSTTCSVMAYKGATQVAATVGTISGLPTGRTESVASNGTIAPVITFTVTTSMNTASGTVNIPVTVDGKTFTKVFSYSIAFRGDPGESINGKMLYKDPEFKKGYNGVSVYDAQNNGGKVMSTRIMKSTGNTSNGDYTSSEAAHIKEEAAGSPHNGSDWCLYIRAYGGTTTSHLGGFCFGNQSRANAVFIVKVSAKIPVGYTLKNVHNSHGTGYKQEFLTPMVGTGKYETYIFKETCGSTGTFSTMNYLFLSGPVKPGNDPLDPDNAPLEWFVDYATVFDLTADGYGDIVEIAKTETVAGINNNPDSVTVYAKKTDFNSLNQVVNQQGSQLQVNTNSIDAIVTKNGSGTIVSIKPEMVEITGATVIKDGNGNKVNIFGVGDKVISVNGGVFSVDKAGKVIMQNAEITGKITAKTGEIGSFTIDGIWLKGSELRISGRQITFENGNNQVYLNSHPDMATGGAVKLGTFVLTGGSYNGLESARAVALIAAAPSDNYSCAIAVTSGRVLMKGQIHFDNVVAYNGSGAVTITADSGHFIHLTPITGNPVVSVSSGLPIGSWFIIAHTTTAGGLYYIKLSGLDRFRLRGNAYQQVNSNNQDPSLIFKVSNTTWVIGNLPVNWIDWN